MDLDLLAMSPGTHGLPEARKEYSTEKTNILSAPPGETHLANEYLDLRFLVSKVWRLQIFS